MTKTIVAILVPLFVAAIIASAKAIVDVQVLKAENKTDRALLLEVRSDVKYILKKFK